MLDVIIAQNMAFQEKIRQLKSTAPKYPEIEFIPKGSTLYANSMVHFVYNGVEFKRHHVQIYHFHPTGLDYEGAKEWLSGRIKEEAELTIEKGKPMFLDDVIGPIS